MADAPEIAEAVTVATPLQIAGAICFGAVIGWHIYAMNRHRKEEPTINDLVSLIGLIGGTAVLALFPARSDLFGAFGIGVAGGFFLYFLVLILLVGFSNGEFKGTWFLDGRRRKPTGDFYIPTREEQGKAIVAPMDRQPGRTASGGTHDG
jgi:hypothetical protein